MKNFAALAILAVALSSAQARPPCSSDVAEPTADFRGETLTAYPMATDIEAVTETMVEYDYSDEATDDVPVYFPEEPATTTTSGYLETEYEYEAPEPDQDAGSKPVTTSDYEETEYEAPEPDQDAGSKPTDVEIDGECETTNPETTTTADYTPTDDLGYEEVETTTTNVHETTDEPEFIHEDKPHSDEVLLKYWYEAGCTTDFPVNEGDNGWWRNQELVIVENDMQLWYEYAMDGEANYKAACFGNQDDLLMQWWREAGCTSDFPMWEKPDGFWHIHPENIVRADMAKWYEKAVNGEALYFAACKPEGM